MKFIKFPDIGQYRNLIRSVKETAQFSGVDQSGKAIFDPLKPLPILELEGTTKLHGTNGAIGYNKSEDALWFQSRERIITPLDDNAGFARTYTDKKNEILKLLPVCDSAHDVAIFGEWCGQGIQKGVAISSLSKRFIVFGVNINGEWQPRSVISNIRNHEIGIYNIYDYPSWKISIDFNKPELSQNKLQELTLAVEHSCPVGAAFGVSGVGEGIVWKVITPGWESPKFWMKVKGEKHSVSKVTTLAAVDVELIKTQKDFVTSVVTEARCLQSLDKLREANKPTDRTSLGDFIRWIYNDILKEESDTASANNLDLTKMGGLISSAAKSWYFANESKLE